MKCPGQDSRYWKEGAIFETTCPRCGAGVEFFKDDTTRVCRACGHRFLNPQMDFGCASYCQYAEQCLGSLSPELLKQRENLLKDRIAIEMKRAFRQDFRKIGHALRVARYVEEIGKGEKADLHTVLPGAFLLDLGERRAREILDALGAPGPWAEEVCGLLLRYEAQALDQGGMDAVLKDALALAAYEEALKTGEAPERGKLSGGLLTGRARELLETVNPAG